MITGSPASAARWIQSSSWASLSVCRTTAVQTQLGGLRSISAARSSWVVSAVDLGLTPPEPAQVGAVDCTHCTLSCHRGITPAYAAASRPGSGPTSRPGLARPSSTTNRSTRHGSFLSPAMYSSSSGRASAS